MDDWVLFLLVTLARWKFSVFLSDDDTGGAFSFRLSCAYTATGVVGHVEVRL